MQVATQPLNALAFLMDGVLYGVGGFAYAARAMTWACLPACATMLAGSRLLGLGSGAADAAAAADGQLLAVWGGLGCLMLLRFGTLYVPLLARRPPFDALWELEEVR